MSKEDQEILVVKRKYLFDNNKNYFNGFSSAENLNFISRILSNMEWKRRGDMEIDPSYKQPIAYCAIVNPESEKVFAYIRSKRDEHYGEKRLQGKLSVGIGGHIEKRD